MKVANYMFNPYRGHDFHNIRNGVQSFKSFAIVSKYNQVATDEKVSHTMQQQGYREKVIQTSDFLTWQRIQLQDEQNEIAYVE